jgi:hypothetical protein
MNNEGNRKQHTAGQIVKGQLLVIVNVRATTEVRPAERIAEAMMDFMVMAVGRLVRGLTRCWERRELLDFQTVAGSLLYLQRRSESRTRAAAIIQLPQRMYTRIKSIFTSSPSNAEIFRLRMSTVVERSSSRTCREFEGRR